MADGQGEARKDMESDNGTAKELLQAMLWLTHDRAISVYFPRLKHRARNSHVNFQNSNPRSANIIVYFSTLRLCHQQSTILDPASSYHQARLYFVLSLVHHAVSTQLPPSDKPQPLPSLSLVKMFYDRGSHCFYSRGLLPVTKQSRIPVPLGSRHDPWKDWEEDFRELCNTESIVTLQPQANEGTASWEKDFDEVCGLDHHVNNVDFAPKAVGDDESDHSTALSIPVHDSFSVSTVDSCNANHGFKDSTSSMVTIVPTTFSTSERQMQQATASFLNPAPDFERDFDVSERQLGPQRNVDADIELDGFPQLPEDALGRNENTLQIESGVLLFEMKSQQGSDASESTSITSSSMASFPTDALQCTNALAKDDVLIVISNVDSASQEEDLETSNLRTAKHNRAGAVSPIFYAINPREHSNERVAAMLGLEVWRTCWSKPP
ncbi:hypothetical protein IWX90DRAFT_417043 [Phyllosticta citrichinensis]|uniref:Uncharacterized protein n=1 Tax=Phyllosticta citrichinensis TaxID=1130410 RepID=A0ABR1XPB3_9PEZI